MMILFHVGIKCDNFKSLIKPGVLSVATQVPGIEALMLGYVGQGYT
jgi:hypothetical protein